MKFIISNVLFKKYPEATIGVVVAKNLDNRGENKEVEQLLRQEEARIKREFSLEGLSQSPSIQNWRESDNTKLTENTRNAFLVIDALPPVTKEVVKVAIDELSSLVSRICSAETKAYVLAADNREIEV